MRTEYFINNNGVTIHCISKHFTPNSTPLIIVPGMGNSAEHIEEDLNNLLTYPHIIISLRGHGKSESPKQGYDFNAQVSDVQAIIQHFNLLQFYIFGISMGVAIAIQIAYNNPNKVKGLIMGDYPPFYPPLDQKWANQALKNLSDSALSEAAINGLVADCVEYKEVMPLLIEINCKTLLICGGQPDSMFPVKFVEKISEMLPQLKVNTLAQSGHWLFEPEPEPLINLITKFVE